MRIIQRVRRLIHNHRTPYDSVIAYVIFATLWILFSDAILNYFIHNADQISWVQTIKGLFFIVVTALLLYTFVHSYNVRQLKILHDLNQSNRYLSAILDGSPLAILDMDLSFRPIYWNAAAERMTGWTAAEVIGQVTPIIPPERKEEMRRIIESAKGGASIGQIETQRLRKDGALFDVSITYAALMDDNGRPDSLLAIIEDITERKKNESERNELIQRLINANSQMTRLTHLTEKRLEWLSALHDIDLAITSSYDLNLTLNIVLDRVNTLLQTDASGVLRYREPVQLLEPVGARGFHTRHYLHTPIRAFEPPAGQALAGSEALIISDLQSLAHHSRASIFTTEGMVAYAAIALVSRSRPLGVIEVFSHEARDWDSDWVQTLESLASQCAIAIENHDLLDHLQRSNQELTQAYDETIEGWSRALDLRDHETEGHTQRVTQLAVSLALHLGVSQGEIPHLQRGALLHDIGKMAIPDHILLKPGPLTDEEWTVMRLHPVYAYNLLRPIEHLNRALEVPYYHHERWDGSGYPNRLQGEQIPLMARIFAVIDVWDALISDRPYRAALSRQQAACYIQENAGILFDPRIVSAFFDMLQENR